MPVCLPSVGSASLSVWRVLPLSDRYADSPWLPTSPELPCASVADQVAVVGKPRSEPLAIGKGRDQEATTGSRGGQSAPSLACFPPVGLRSSARFDNLRRKSRQSREVESHVSLSYFWGCVLCVSRRERGRGGTQRPLYSLLNTKIESLCKTVIIIVVCAAVSMIVRNRM